MKTPRYLLMVLIAVIAFGIGYAVRGGGQGSNGMSISSPLIPAANPDVGDCARLQGMTSAVCTCLHGQMPQADFHLAVQIMQITSNRELTEEQRRLQVMSLVSANPTQGAVVGREMELGMQQCRSAG